MALSATAGVVAVLIALLSAGYLHIAPRWWSPVVDPSAVSIFDFKVPVGDGDSTVSLAEYKGKKAYLVVNVACKCGLTDKNYAELQDLYEKYRLKGLEILAFPCNNFGGQEPGPYAEIIDYVREKKQANFPVLGKVECDNRQKTHPLFAFLMSKVSNGVFGPGLMWNFAKFLCDENGVPVRRYLPVQSPLSFEKDIEDILR